MKDDFNITDLEITYEYQDEVLQETLRQLEYKSVLEFISKFAISELGRELIMKSMPVNDIDLLLLEHNLIDEVTKMVYQDSLPQLFGISDIRHKLYKSMIENAILSSTEILNILDTIRVFRVVRNHFYDKEEQFENLCKMTKELYDNKILEKHISDAIDDSGEIRDNATRELQRIRTDIRVKSARLRDRLHRILKKVSAEDLIRDDFYSVREGRFVLPMKVENKRALPGIIHGISQTGSTVFLEPSEIIEMNNELSLLHNEEQREIYKILSNLTNEIGQEANKFLVSLSLIAHFDSLIAKAKYAVEFGGIKPDIISENYIYLKEIRHPLLVHTKGKKNVIPMSVEFNNNIRGHLISGPNAGGKTVALKSVGLNILMAISGIFPLGTCQTNFRYIFTSIGDQQSIENDLSTFSSQILRLKKIVENCNSDSLVLIDEIGSGTDPQEGAALASSILDTFLNVKLFFIATTHQSSLKTYALNKPEIENASLEFNQEKIKPTYKFLNGIPGNSYAFFLAQNIGLPVHIIDRAKSYLGSKQNELESSIQILQKYKADAQQFALELASEKLKYEKVRKEYDDKLGELKSKKSELINKAKIEADSILNAANSTIEKTIKDIKESQKPVVEIKNEFKAAKEKLENEVKLINKLNSNDGETPTHLQPGDTVVLIGTNSKGTVIEAKDKQLNALVEFNGFKVKISYAELRCSKPEKVVKDISNYIKFDTKARLDVRGLRADETIKQLDEFIQNAIVNSLSMATIVHGKGTGALRQVIQQYLKDIDQISSFRLGELVEGGSGVTIVNFK